jgi:hypothetical protein
MLFTCHRINTINELKNISTANGIEIDLRDDIYGNIYLHHDPYLMGEKFDDFLNNYKHSFIILNIKSEGIEFKIMEILKKFKITEYFFLDSSFPMIYKLSKNNIKNIALRFSEFEGLDTIKSMQNKINWIWVDCFTKNPLNKKLYDQFKSMNYKLCFVSPELQQQTEKIDIYKKYFKDNNIHFDMICTKDYNISKWK